MALLTIESRRFSFQSRSLRSLFWRTTPFARCGAVDSACKLQPNQLWDDYWVSSPEAIKHAFVADIADGYMENETRLQEKRHALSRALISVGVAAAAIGAALALSNF